VFRKVDEGANPDLVTKEYFESCRQKNDEARGRLFATKLFHDQLEARLNLWDPQAPPASATKRVKSP
jgi:BMFP domain-containing protein YqiC